MKLLTTTTVILISFFSQVVQAQSWLPAKTQDGWSVLTGYLVPSDGSRSLGVIMNFNDERDTGSKILFFDPEAGDNQSAQVYWWNGTHIIDSAGNTQNDEGEIYGTNPLEPNLNAIAPFATLTGMRGNADGDLRIRTHHRSQYRVAGYPDWFLFRRGAEHTLFDGALAGGRSGMEPMVVAAYGPKEDGRAIFNPQVTTIEYNGNERETTSNPLGAHAGGEDPVFFHMVYAGLELHIRIGNLGTHTARSPSGGVPTLHVEDCKLIAAPMVYLARESYIYRSVSVFNFNPDAHNQGYFNSGFEAEVQFEETIFYKNGYKNDPRTHADPRRDIFSRNIYQGGGAQMGHPYRGIISADGASGGPQMRLGGICENSLIIEGYFFSSTSSNELVNPWLPGQNGRSAHVRNNVQFVYRYPNFLDPDTYDDSDNRAQPGWGYTLQGASFGSVVEGNIISGAMLYNNDEEIMALTGIGMNTDVYTYQDERIYSLLGNTIRDNIVYHTRRGLSLEGDWSSASGNMVEDNVFVSREAVSERSFSDPDLNILNVRSNRFYHQEEELAPGSYLGKNNLSLPYEDAGTREEWPDPDRTLLRYVTEVCGLSLLDWNDDPWLPQDEIAPRQDAGEAYDPFGIKTFMAVATNMRWGGALAVPQSGKPSWEGDYMWDPRFTGLAVVNWVREGFGLEKVQQQYYDDKQTAIFNYPNPFTEATTFSFMVPVAGKYTLVIYDINGRLIDTVIESEFQEGRHTIAWDISRSGGKQIAGGMYFYMLRNDNQFFHSGKMILLR